MRTTGILGIWLLVVTLACVGFAAAESETTYYCYDPATQGWRVCTPSEEDSAAEALSRDTPRSLTPDEWDSVINSRSPYWGYNSDLPERRDTPAVTPEPTPTVTPTPTKTPSSPARQDAMEFFSTMIRNRLPSKELGIPFPRLRPAGP